MGGPAPSGGPRALAVVPARLASTRLERKLLLRESGRYLFEHTVRNAERCAALDAVVLAVDADELLEAARSAGVRAVPTSTEHASGTDRVREAHRALLAAGDGPWEVVVNVQGDEPELDPDHLARLVACFDAPEVEAATLCAPLRDPAQVEDASTVKVVRDRAGFALYFSRAPIPVRRDPDAADDDEPLAWRHVGVYAYRPAALEDFCELPRGDLERRESLEQLRWLEAGRRMRVVEVDRAPPGIDTRADYEAFLGRCSGDYSRSVRGRARRGD